MISEETNKPHQKHAKLNRPALGEFGRNEIAILGTTCANIRQLAGKIIGGLASYKVAYVDADHKGADSEVAANDSILTAGASVEYTDKLSFQRLDLKNQLDVFQRRTLFNEQDLIIINGNHFKGTCQIVVIDPLKNLEKKKEQLTDVKLILLNDSAQKVPAFLQESRGSSSVPVLSVNDVDGIITFLRNFLTQSIPPLYGLVLSGGLSSRMKKDKGNLSYHGTSQREYLFNLLSKFCDQTFISCNATQTVEVGNAFPVIEDSFLHLGPVGGILSAFQTNPNAAWLVVACDLPFLTEKSIQYLVHNRNISKNATAFLDANKEFPEPLITIWEPKSYSLLLQYLSQGYSCPRKVLINSDVELLKAPEEKEFLNANSPEEYAFALQELKQGNS